MYYIYIFRLTCEEEDIYLPESGLFFITQSFSFILLFFHSFFFFSWWTLAFVRLALQCGSKYRNEILILCLHSCMLCFFSTLQPWPRSRAERFPGNTTALNGSTESCLSKASGGFKNEKEGLGVDFSQEWWVQATLPISSFPPTGLVSNGSFGYHRHAEEPGWPGGSGWMILIAT